MEQDNRDSKTLSRGAPPIISLYGTIRSEEIRRGAAVSLTTQGTSLKEQKGFAGGGSVPAYCMRNHTIIQGVEYSDVVSSPLMFANSA